MREYITQYMKFFLTCHALSKRDMVNMESSTHFLSHNKHGKNYQ